MVFFLRLFRLRYNLTANLVRPNYKTTIDNDEKAGNGEIISLKNSLKTTTIVRDNDEKAGNGRNNQLEKFFKNYYNKLLFMT